MDILLIKDGSEHLFAKKTEELAQQTSLQIEARRWSKTEYLDYEFAPSFYGETRKELGMKTYPMQGVLLKDTDYSWYENTMVSIKKSIMEGEADDSILCHILNIDSPGGQVTFCSTLAAYVKNEVAKPIYAIINGDCCSAAYWIASACDKIYATERIDTIGSIGVMTMFTSSDDYLKKQGIVNVTVYAPQSSEKNSTMREARSGNILPLQNEVLAPIAAEFINTVKANRSIIDDTHVYKGKDYNANEALAIGLIDGIKNEEEIKLMAFNEGLKLYNKKNMTTHTLSNLANLIGSKTDTFQATADGKITIAVNDVIAIDEALAGLDPKLAALVHDPIVQAVATPAVADPQLTKADIEALLDKQQKGFNAQIEALKKAAQTPPVRVADGGGSDDPIVLDEKMQAAIDAVSVLG